MSKLEWVPDAVAPHVKRLADAIGAHVDALVTAAIDRAIAALAPPPASTAFTAFGYEIAPVVPLPPSAPISPPSVIVDRDPKPDNVIRGACSKCKQPGHNARSCGRAPKGPIRTPRATTEPMTAVAPSPRAPTPYEVAAAKARIANRTAAQQLAAMRAPAPRVERIPDLENDNADERWSSREIAEETEAAEARKLGGELPIPRSSWEF